jgi:cytidine deaminase
MTSAPAIEDIVQQADTFFAAGNIAAGSLYLLFARYREQCSPEEKAPGRYTELAKQYASTLQRYVALLDLTRHHALQAREQAYAPYSNFAVGAALLAADGTIWKGCNVESGSYGLTICAERTALVSAVAGGKRHFQAVVVTSGASSPTPPCGACRQLLYEFAPRALVVMLTTEGREKWTTMDRLLPDAFDESSLL